MFERYPGICEYVMLHSKRDSADLIKVKIGRLSWNIKCAHLITWIVRGREASLGGVRSQRDLKHERDSTGYCWFKDGVGYMRRKVADLK